MSSDSITITNNTKVAIDIVILQDSSVATTDRIKKHTIIPNEYFVVFTNKIQTLSWEKPKG